jgi:hypothetical protein
VTSAVGVVSPIGDPLSHGEAKDRVARMRRRDGAGE